MALEKLGVEVSEEEVQRLMGDFAKFRRNLSQIQDPCVIIPGCRRIIPVNDFFKPSEEESLYWEELSEFRTRTKYGPAVKRALFRGAGPSAFGFDGLFEILLETLVKQNKMSFHQEKGVYLINEGGIPVHYPDGFDPYGRSSNDVNFYYPRLEGDAISYAKFFHDSRSLSIVTKVIEKVQGHKNIYAVD